MIDTRGRTVSASLPPVRISEFQLRMLSRFVTRARGTTSYYGNRFEKLIASDTSFYDHWRDIPILTKYDVRDEFDRLAAVNVPYGAGAVATSFTTGSTGTPIKVLRSEYADRINVDMNARVFRTWGLDRDKSFLVQLVRGISEGTTFSTISPWHPDGGTGTQGLMKTSASGDHLNKVVEFRPAYLKSYPLTLASQAELARDDGVEISFDLIISNGSVLPQWVRALCRDVFGSRIADIYGAKETGLIAYECLDCGEFHMFFENVFTELIKDNGEPAAPGETGHVIVTPFHNDAMPLVRFDIGDLATRGTGIGSCADQPFTITNIVGRTKSNFVKPDGTIFYPRMSHEKAVKAGIKRYRIVQVERGRIELRYFPVAGEILPDEELVDLMRDQIGNEFEYVLKRADRLQDLDHPKLLTFESLVLRDQHD